MKLSEIARALSAEVNGDASLDIRRIVHPLDAEGPADLAVALSKDALSASGGSPAGAVLVPSDAPPPADGRTVLVYAGNEREAIAILTAMFDHGPGHDDGIHATAVVAADAALGEAISIGPHAVIGSRSALGDRTAVLANATVGADVVIGKNCLVHPGAVIADRVTIGDRVVIHANAVIGSDGFGFIPARKPEASGGDEDTPKRIYSLGTVVIGNDVEVGAGTTIDRATLRQTRIGDGTKIDNQVQIGHNVTIGKSCLVCGMVGIAGSSAIGDRVLIAAAAGISDHVTIGSGATVAAMAGVATNIPPGIVVSGIPADRHETTLQRLAGVGRLRVLYPRVDELKKRLDALEKSAKGA